MWSFGDTWIGGTGTAPFADCMVVTSTGQFQQKNCGDRYTMLCEMDSGKSHNPLDPGIFLENNFKYQNDPNSKFEGAILAQ